MRHQPTIALLRRLAAALDSDVHMIAGHDLGSVWFETMQPDLIRPPRLFPARSERPSHTATCNVVEKLNIRRSARLCVGNNRR
jgi:hypothetical protein